MKKFLLFIIIIVLVCGCKKEEKDNTSTEIDLSDVSNVSIIDAKLGDDIKITTSYLMTYITKKSGIWYMSEGIIKDINSSNGKTIYSITNDSNTILKGSIDSEKEILKKNTKVYFVFTIDLSNGDLKLVKISNDPIDYNSVTNISFDDLYDNIKKLLNTKFIINGYMVTINDKYVLYDTKSDYEKESKDYFVINWEGDPKYTGNAPVVLSCNINNIYSLKNCNVVTN